VGKTHRLAAALAVSALLGIAVACTSETNDTNADSDRTATNEEDFLKVYPLPFGLEHVEGTTAIGRPAVYDSIVLEYDGIPVEGRILKAAFRVDAKDPGAVLREWVDQINELGVGEVSIRAGGGPDSGAGPETPWLQADFYDGEVAGNGADLQLWTTGEAPVLLVSVTFVEPGGTPDLSIDDDAEGVAAPESVVDDSDRVEGDVLFSEQGDAIHLPDRSRSLMPTIPTFGGTGGSTSVLSAADGAAAVQDLIDEADATTPAGDVTAPMTTVLDGIDVVNASFNISAGGWGFSVVAVQGPDDPAATLHVVSYAD